MTTQTITYRIHAVIEGQHYNLGEQPDASRASLNAAAGAHTMAERGFSADCHIEWRGDRLTVRNPESGTLYGVVARCICDETEDPETRRLDRARAGD